MNPVFQAFHKIAQAMAECEIETMCARLREARITLEQAEAELNIACGEGTRKQILECDASYRKALDVVIDMEDRIEQAQRLLEVRIG